MERKDYEKIIKKNPDFVLKKDLKIKQKNNILKHIAKDIPENDIIAFHDGALFSKTGKTGILVAKHALYYNFENTKVPFDGVVDFSYEKKSSVSVDALLTYQDGRKERVFLCLNGDIERFMEMVQAIVEQYNAGKSVKEEPVAPKAVEKMPVKQEVPKEERLPLEQEKKEEAKVDPGLVEVWVETALGYIQNREYDKAYPFALDAAKAGDSCGMNMVGMYYMNCDNRTEALRWYEKAANAGDAYSQWHVGCWYQSGQYVPQDYLKAYYWFSKGAEQNYARAWGSLGDLYVEGNGIPKNLDAAFDAYFKGAEMGDTLSITGLLYGVAGGSFKPTKEHCLKILEYGKGLLEKKPDVKWAVDAIEQEAMKLGWIGAPKSVEAPKPAEASKPVEAPKPAEAPKPVEAPKPAEAPKPVEAPKLADTPKAVKPSVPYAEKIEKIKSELEKIRQERDFSSSLMWYDSQGEIEHSKEIVEFLWVEKFDLEMTILDSDSGKGLLYVTEMNRWEAYRVGDAYDWEKDEKNYKGLLDAARNTFASKKVAAIMSEYAKSADLERNINLAFLGKKEKDKAELMAAMVQNIERKKGVISVQELEEQKATNSIVSAKCESPSHNKYRIFDCIDDIGCVREMLTGCSEWDAAIIVYDVENWDDDWEQLTKWACWLEHAMVGHVFVYIKVPTLFPDDVMEEMIDFMRGDIYENLSFYYNGQIEFFEGLVPQLVKDPMGEGAGSVFDIVSEVEAIHEWRHP